MLKAGWGVQTLPGGGGSGKINFSGTMKRQTWSQVLVENELRGACQEFGHGEVLGPSAFLFKEEET